MTPSPGFIFGDSHRSSASIFALVCRPGRKAPQLRDASRRCGDCCGNSPHCRGAASEEGTNLKVSAHHLFDVLVGGTSPGRSRLVQACGRLVVDGTASCLGEAAAARWQRISNSQSSASCKLRLVLPLTQSIPTPTIVADLLASLCTA